MAAPPTFEVIPALDLLDGRVVRLTGGDLTAPRRYRIDPTTAARRFAAAGARWIHVVDLDGARRGVPSQIHRVAAVVEAVAPLARIQVGGGIRSVDDASRLFAVGVGRIVVGTAAFTNPALVPQILAAYGADRVAVALDVAGQGLLGSGWRSVAAPSVEGAVHHLVDAGIRIFVATAVGRDGRLAGPDPELVVRVVRAAGASGAVRVYAAGGVAGEADLAILRDRGASGAIVGRALYEGRLDLARAIRRVGRP